MRGQSLLRVVVGTFAVFQLGFMSLVTDIVSQECSDEAIFTPQVPSCGYRYAMVVTMILSGLGILFASAFGNRSSHLLIISHVMGWVAFLSVLVYIVGIFSANKYSHLSNYERENVFSIPLAAITLSVRSLKSVEVINAGSSLSLYGLKKEEDKLTQSYLPQPF